MTSVDLILQRILQKCLIHPPVSTSSLSLASQSTPSQPIADIALPDAPSLQPALMAAGAPPEISLAIDQVYQKRAADLRVLCHRTIASLCSNQYSSQQKTESLLSELYLRELVTWREEVVALYLKHPAVGNKAQLSTSAPKFNHVRPTSKFHSPSLTCLLPDLVLIPCTGIRTFTRTFFSRKPFPYTCRQGIFGQEIKYDVSPDTCLGTNAFIWFHMI